MRLEITHSRDQDGRRLISVPLTNVDRNVILYHDDFDRLIALGLDPRWRLSNNQVMERGRARIIVARLLRNAGAHEKVQYLDRDPCNLRTDNLVISSGGGKHSTEDRLDPNKRPARFLDKVELIHKQILPSWETGRTFHEHL